MPGICRRKCGRRFGAPTSSFTRATGRAPSCSTASKNEPRRVIGCYGNNDSDDVRSRLSEIARLDCDGVQLVVVHETRGSKHREERVDRRFTAADLLVFGHSHIPWDTTSPAGIRLLNPGSPTDRRRQPFATYMTVELANAAIKWVDLHPLPAR